jgi:class 3 adenylate cyclase
MREGDDVDESGPLPTGTVTLLLADVEGSSRLWETEPEAMTAAIARLDAVVSYGGRHRCRMDDPRGRMVRVDDAGRSQTLPAGGTSGGSSVGGWVSHRQAAAFS